MVNEHRYYSTFMCQIRKQNLFFCFSHNFLFLAIGFVKLSASNVDEKCFTKLIPSRNSPQYLIITKLCLSFLSFSEKYCDMIFWCLCVPYVVGSLLFIHKVLLPIFPLDCLSFKVCRYSPPSSLPCCCGSRYNVHFA